MMAWAILIQASEMRKVQRLSREGVGSSDPKRTAPVNQGDDIVSSYVKA